MDLILPKPLDSWKHQTFHIHKYVDTVPIFTTADVQDFMAFSAMLLEKKFLLRRVSQIITFLQMAQRYSYHTNLMLFLFTAFLFCIFQCDEHHFSPEMSLFHALAHYTTHGCMNKVKTGVIKWMKRNWMEVYQVGRDVLNHLNLTPLQYIQQLEQNHTFQPDALTVYSAARYLKIHIGVQMEETFWATNKEVYRGRPRGPHNVMLVMFAPGYYFDLHNYICGQNLKSQAHFQEGDSLHRGVMAPTAENIVEIQSLMLSYSCSDQTSTEMGTDSALDLTTTDSDEHIQAVQFKFRNADVVKDTETLLKIYTCQSDETMSDASGYLVDENPISTSSPKPAAVFDLKVSTIPPIKLKLTDVPGEKKKKRPLEEKLIKEKLAAGKDIDDSSFESDPENAEIRIEEMEAEIKKNKRNDNHAPRTNRFWGQRGKALRMRKYCRKIKKRETWRENVNKIKKKFIYRLKSTQKKLLSHVEPIPVHCVKSQENPVHEMDPAVTEINQPSNVDQKKKGNKIAQKRQYQTDPKRRTRSSSKQPKMEVPSNFTTDNQMTLLPTISSTSEVNKKVDTVSQAVLQHSETSESKNFPAIRPGTKKRQTARKTTGGKKTRKTVPGKELTKSNKSSTEIAKSFAETSIPQDPPSFVKNETNSPGTEVIPPSTPRKFKTKAELKQPPHFIKKEQTGISNVIPASIKKVNINVNTNPRAYPPLVINTTVHKKSGHREILTPCPICKQQFKKETMCEHVENKHNSFLCLTCNTVFNTNKAFKDHIKKHGDNGLVCDVCSKKFSYTSDLRQHYKCHIDTKDIPCPKCDKIYKRQSDLNFHMDNKHNPQKPNFLCTTCGKNYPTSKSLTQHQKSHAPPKHVCTICDEKFKWASQLSRHMKADH